MGLSFEEMAEQITRVGRNKSPALVAIPQGVTFPENYSITRQACHKAFRKALARQPALELEELRKLDNARSEEMFLNLQPGIRKGNVRAIEVGIKVLDHSAKINGHAAPQRHELTGTNGKERKAADPMISKEDWRAPLECAARERIPLLTVPIS
jgi:hypothetical protein